MEWMNVKYKMPDMPVSSDTNELVMVTDGKSVCVTTVLDWLPGQRRGMKKLGEITHWAPVPDIPQDIKGVERLHRGEECARVIAKIELATRFITDSGKAPNIFCEYNDLHGAHECLSSAYNMLSNVMEKHEALQNKEFNRRGTVAFVEIPQCPEVINAPTR